AALLSVGCTIEAAEAVAKGYCKHAIALVRPPGHHAMESEPNGFCFFNNVAIAAKKIMRDKYARKIAIIDWDVHHGQGTQRAFYDSPDILYISIHRFEYGLFWPHLRESDIDHVGQGAGRGFNVNIPLNETGCGDLEYIYIFLRVILPVLTDFKPELIMISAGYDAALGCPEGMRIIDTYSRRFFRLRDTFRAKN
uniref:Histone deacetylase domain-containing protein n=1 Tax=Romanomermis culicivorax TaxID=13658 RepID=A0A915ISW8_ROMCU